eukprot:13633106-Alexandrium_andersonii.AAC.1
MLAWPFRGPQKGSASGVCASFRVRVRGSVRVSVRVRGRVSLDALFTVVAMGDRVRVRVRAR